MPLKTSKKEANKSVKGEDAGAKTTKWTGIKMFYVNY